MITTSNRKPDGNAGRIAAIELLESRRQVYVNRGRRALLLRLLTGEPATADDVRAAVELPETIDPVCLGAVPGSLARAGIITRAGFVATARPDAHARPVSIWMLSDREAALQWLIDHPEIPEPPPPAQEKAQRLLGLIGEPMQ